jgi:recombinational DNA repair protein (RecF pathway)
MDCLKCGQKGLFNVKHYQSQTVCARCWELSLLKSHVETKGVSKFPVRHATELPPAPLQFSRKQK